MDGSFGDDVGVEAVAKVNRVDVIAGGRTGQHWVGKAVRIGLGHTIRDRCT